MSIGNRTGVNTGEVVAGDTAAGATLATGDAVNVAARLEQAAAPGEILLGDGTYRLVRHAVRAEAIDPLALKGKERPVPAHRLIEALVDAGPRERRLVAPLVGRDQELRQLLDAFERVLADRSCRLMRVLGAAGLGKSRLVAEAVTKLRPYAQVLHGRCLPYGEGITFWPVHSILKEAAGVMDTDTSDEVLSRLTKLLETLDIDSADVPRLATLMGLAASGTTIEEGFRALRLLLQAMSRQQPLVVVVEDIHWAEAALLDLLAHVVNLARNGPILFLCPARPELEETRLNWDAEIPNASTIRLQPLTDEQSRALVPAALGAAALEEVADRIAEAAGGNPLFVEEMLGMLIDEGALSKDQRGWRVTKTLATVPVPATISALIAARLDRLPREERATIERASVVGKDFQRHAMVALSDDHPVDGPLAQLTRKDFVVPGPSPDEFSFRHILIRDGAYAGLPKQLRADLHQRYAGWLEHFLGERVVGHEEILGYHLEQAFRYRQQLSLSDETTAALADRAARMLTLAGRGALGRSDIGAATIILRRTVALLPPDARGPILPDLAYAQRESGDFRGAQASLQEALLASEVIDDRGLATRARLDLGFLRLMMSELLMEDFLHQAEAAVEAFEALGDERGLALAWHDVGRARLWLGASAESENALQRSVEYARRIGDQQLVSESLLWLCCAVQVGPRPLEEVIPLLEEVRRSSGAMIVEGAALAFLAIAEAMQGRFQEARAHLRQAVSVLEELGQHLILAGLHPLAEVELLAGNPRGALEQLQPGVEELRRVGEKGYLSTSAAWLAEAEYELTNYERAEEWTPQSEETASADDAETQFRWRGIRAKILARRGSLEEAETMAREAVRLAVGTDNPGWHGLAYDDLGEVRALAGRTEEAAKAHAEALAAYERKGTVVMAERSRARIKNLVSSTKT